MRSFSYADKGIHVGIRYKYVCKTKRKKGNTNVFSTPWDKATLLEYYCFYFWHEHMNPYCVQWSVEQQIIVTTYSCVEANHLAQHLFGEADMRSKPAKRDSEY
jgi:hypothetical protein